MNYAVVIIHTTCLIGVNNKFYYIKCRLLPTNNCYYCNFYYSNSHFKYRLLEFPLNNSFQIELRVIKKRKKSLKNILIL